MSEQGILDEAEAVMRGIRLAGEWGNHAGIVARALRAERERCAQIAETIEVPDDGEYWIARRIARAIRDGAEPQ